MNSLIAFIIPMVILLITKKYWIGFVFGALIFFVVYQELLDTEPMNRNDSITDKIGDTLGAYAIPFIIAAIIWGVTKKKQPDKEEQKSADNEH